MTLSARRLLTGIGLLLAVAFGIAVNRAAAARAAISLPDYGPLPEFSLTDQAGQPVTRATLQGVVWIADFIFTRCAGQCPMMAVQMATLQKRFSGATDVQLVSFTVDPVHDTPEALAAYGRHYGAISPKWRFLTGDRDAIWRIAHDGFKLGVSEDGTAEEPIVHSVRLVLVDRQAHVRGYYDATDPMAVERLFQDAHHMLSEGR